jgi:hypothetical protein
MKSNGEKLFLARRLASERIRDKCRNANRLASISLKYEPRELEFGTGGRRGKVVDLTQLDVYINALAELEYLQSLDTSDGGIVRGREFLFARDLRRGLRQFCAGAARRASREYGYRDPKAGALLRRNVEERLARRGAKQA